MQVKILNLKKIKNRKKSYYARHANNIAKGKMSAAYWADKVKVVIWQKQLVGSGVAKHIRGTVIRETKNFIYARTHNGKTKKIKKKK